MLLRTGTSQQTYIGFCDTPRDSNDQKNPWALENDSKRYFSVVQRFWRYYTEETHGSKTARCVFCYSQVYLVKTFLSRHEEVGDPAFLTPFLEAGKIQEARQMARVHLEEWPQMESYAGFFRVNAKYNSHLYFWFFPSQNNPSNDPVILWLQVRTLHSDLVI